MATRRKLPEQPQESLEQMVSLYSVNKDKIKVIEKVVNSYNSKIKDAMQALNLTEFVAGDIKASISVTQNEDFNELQAIEILRTSLPKEKFTDVVKTREYLDDNAFEKLVYNKEVDASILNPCRTPKNATVTLRIGKAKN